MNTLVIYRAGNPVVTVDIDENTRFVHKIMGDHKVSSRFMTSEVIAIQIGDYITVGTDNFYINRLPSLTKFNSNTFQYEIDFEGVVYNLGKKLFISTDGLAQYGKAGQAVDFVTDIVSNMNTIDSGWTVGTVAETEEKTIVFSSENCWKSLVKVAEEFELEFSLTGKSISLIKSVGADTVLSFQYGRNSGLYKIERQQIKDQNIVTKVWGFGSTANIPFTYRDRAKRLVFEERFLTKNTEIYGTIEGEYTNDDIFPHRTAALTGAVMTFVGDKYDNGASYLEDSELNGASGFNINDCLIEGVTAMVVFKSGDLSGQEFEIWRYVQAEARIYINPQSDEDGFTTPNPLNLAKAGDLYTIVNISQPQMYVDVAEASLKEATQAFLDENSVPKVVYSVDLDPKYAKTNAIAINAGDRVTVVDSSLGVNDLIRVSQVEYPLSNPYKIKAYIADFVPYTMQERIIKDMVSTFTEMVIVDRTSDELARRNAMRQRQLKDIIFDSDGYFDVTNIRPLSIETMYLAVGTASQNFHLSGVRIIANYLSDPNRIYISTGELHHHEMEIEGLGSNWVLGSAYDSGVDALTDEVPYYVYAKCSTTQLTGEWVVSASQIKTNDVPGYYHFVVGVLYAVFEGARDYDFTFGMTYINGRTITTGKIRSLDGLNWFDLDQNKFTLGEGQSSGLDWDGNVLTLRGSMVQRSPGVSYPVLLFRGIWNIATVYHKGDMVTYNGGSWIYVSETSSDGIIPAEGAYWTLSASDGTQGDDGTSPVGIFRGNWNPGTDYYGTPSRADIVYNTFDSLYYIAKTNAGNPFKGMRPDQYPDRWNNFGAQFESIATKLMFAESTVIENASIQYFNGIPVGVGDLGLNDSVQHTTPNSVGQARVDYIDFTGGSEGSARLLCDLIEKDVDWQGSTSATAERFVSLYRYDYLNVGVDISQDIGNPSRVRFLEVDGNDFQEATYFTGLSGDMTGGSGTLYSHTEGAKRVDTIPLTGTGGSCYIKANNYYKSLFFEDNIANTIDNFIDQAASEYYLRGIVVTRDGNSIVLTSRWKGQDFLSDTEIHNDPAVFAGGTSIAGNHIWDDVTNGPATILINVKGYNGGFSMRRMLIIGNGQNERVLTVGKDSDDKDVVQIDVDKLKIDISRMSRTNSGLLSGECWVDAGGYLRIQE